MGIGGCFGNPTVDDDLYSLIFIKKLEQNLEKEDFSNSDTATRLLYEELQRRKQLLDNNLIERKTSLNENSQTDGLNSAMAPATPAISLQQNKHYKVDTSPKVNYSNIHGRATNHDRHNSDSILESQGNMNRYTARAHSENREMPIYEYVEQTQTQNEVQNVVDMGAIQRAINQLEQASTPQQQQAIGQLIQGVYQLNFENTKLKKNQEDKQGDSLRHVNSTFLNYRTIGDDSKAKNNGNVETLERDLAQCYEQIDDLRTQLEVKTASEQQLRNQQEDIKTQMKSQLKLLVDDTQTLRAKWQSERNQLEAQIETMNREKASIKVENAQLREAADSSEIKLKQRVREVTQAMEEERNQVMVSLEEEIGVMELKIQETEEQKDTLQIELNSLRQQVTKLNFESKEQQARITQQQKFLQEEFNRVVSVLIKDLKKLQDGGMDSNRGPGGMSARGSMRGSVDSARGPRASLWENLQHLMGALNADKGQKQEVEEILQSLEKNRGKIEAELQNQDIEIWKKQVLSFSHYNNQLGAISGYPGVLEMLKELGEVMTFISNAIEQKLFQNKGEEDKDAIRQELHQKIQEMNFITQENSELAFKIKNKSKHEEKLQLQIENLTKQIRIYEKMYANGQPTNDKQNSKLQMMSQAKKQQELVDALEKLEKLRQQLNHKYSRVKILISRLSNMIDRLDISELELQKFLTDSRARQKQTLKQPTNKGKDSGGSSKQRNNQSGEDSDSSDINDEQYDEFESLIRQKINNFKQRNQASGSTKQSVNITQQRSQQSTARTYDGTENRSPRRGYVEPTTPTPSARYGRTAMDMSDARGPPPQRKEANVYDKASSVSSRPQRPAKSNQTKHQLNNLINRMVDIYDSFEVENQSQLNSQQTNDQETWRNRRGTRRPEGLSPLKEGHDYEQDRQQPRRSAQRLDPRYNDGSGERTVSALSQHNLSLHNQEDGSVNNSRHSTRYSQQRGGGSKQQYYSRENTENSALSRGRGGQTKNYQASEYSQQLPLQRQTIKENSRYDLEQSVESSPPVKVLQQKSSPYSRKSNILGYDKQPVSTFKLDLDLGESSQSQEREKQNKFTPRQDLSPMAQRSRSQQAPPRKPRQSVEMKLEQFEKDYRQNERQIQQSLKYAGPPSMQASSSSRRRYVHPQYEPRSMGNLSNRSDQLGKVSKLRNEIEVNKRREPSIPSRDSQGLREPQSMSGRVSYAQSEDFSNKQRQDQANPLAKFPINYGIANMKGLFRNEQNAGFSEDEVSQDFQIRGSQTARDRGERRSINNIPLSRDYREHQERQFQRNQLKSFINEEDEMLLSMSMDGAARTKHSNVQITLQPPPLLQMQQAKPKKSPNHPVQLVDNSVNTTLERQANIEQINLSQTPRLIKKHNSKEDGPRGSNVFKQIFKRGKNRF